MPSAPSLNPGFLPTAGSAATVSISRVGGGVGILGRVLRVGAIVAGMWWAGLVTAQGTLTLKGLLPLQVDHRPSQSPVKSQGGRGTCIAFSVAAMMETFDGVPADLSEQAAYGYIKLEEMGTGEVTPGGLLANYPKLLTEVGFMHESVAPYDPKAGLWTEDDSLLKRYLEEGKTGIRDMLRRVGTTRYGAEARDVIFLGDPEARDIGALKRLLANGHRAVAVGYTDLYVPFWRTIQDGVITPEEGFLFQIGDRQYSYRAAKALRPNLADDVVAKRVKVVRSKPDESRAYGGHAVTAVGYTRDGFLIKNSWGRGWGKEGYAVVSFDYHRMFCDEVLAVKQPVIRVQAPAVRALPAIYLKTRPNVSAGKPVLRLSLFGPHEGGVPQFKSLKWEIYEQTDKGERGRLVGFPPPSFVTLTAPGNPIDVLEGVKPGSDEARKKYRIEIAFTPVGELMERVVVFQGVTWGTGEFQGH